MQTVLRKVSTAFQYATTPTRYPFVWRKTVGRAILGAPACLETSATESLKWCSTHAISNQDAVRRLTQKKASKELANRFPQVYAAASKAVADCPQKMGGPAHTSLLFDLIANTSASQILETGVAYGWSSLAILLALSQKRQGHLVSTNLHYREFAEDDRYVGCAVPAHLRDRWTIIPKADSEAIPEALEHFPNGVDICHYDSNKSYGGRLASYPLLWRALNVGGLFVSDDIQDNLAFAHFCRMVKASPIVTPASTTNGHGKYVGILRKESDFIRTIQF